jgi:hypothetical protein
VPAAKTCIGNSAFPVASSIPLPCAPEEFVSEKATVPVAFLKGFGLEAWDFPIGCASTETYVPYGTDFPARLVRFPEASAMLTESCRMLASGVTVICVGAEMLLA